MVKYTDYTVLCCFVFPLGFAVSTLLALFEGRQEREEGLYCIPRGTRHTREAGRAGGAVVNSITLQEVGQGPPNFSCMLCPALLGGRWISP